MALQLAFVSSSEQRVLRHLHRPPVRGVGLDVSILPHQREAQWALAGTVLFKLVHGLVPRHMESERVNRPRLSVDDRLEEKLQATDRWGEGSEDRGVRLLTFLRIRRTGVCGGQHKTDQGSMLTRNSVRRGAETKQVVEACRDAATRQLSESKHVHED